MIKTPLVALVIAMLFLCSCMFHPALCVQPTADDGSTWSAWSNDEDGG